MCCVPSGEDPGTSVENVSTVLCPSPAPSCTSLPTVLDTSARRPSAPTREICSSLVRTFPSSVTVLCLTSPACQFPSPSGSSVDFSICTVCSPVCSCRSSTFMAGAIPPFTPGRYTVVVVCSTLGAVFFVTCSSRCTTCLRPLESGFDVERTTRLPPSASVCFSSSVVCTSARCPLLSRP